jgi:hypothetical protein
MLLSEDVAATRAQFRVEYSSTSTAVPATKVSVQSMEVSSQMSASLFTMRRKKHRMPATYWRCASTLFYLSGRKALVWTPRHFRRHRA